MHTTAAGQHIHLLHTRSSEPDAIPLVLIHGWPGSIIEFLDAVYPGELLQTPRAWAEKRYNLVHYTVAERGGHFAALENPQWFAADVIAFGQRLHELGMAP